MAPGSFECLLQTTSSTQNEQQQEEEVKSHITSSLCAPSWPFFFFHSFKSLVFRVWGTEPSFSERRQHWRTRNGRFVKRMSFPPPERESILP